MIGDSTLQSLKIEVERIVRPIRASRRRLDRMREELWGHLLGRAESLIDEGWDESDAAAEGLRLLGDRRPLSAGLQASVPFVERVLWTRWDAPRWIERGARLLWGMDETGSVARRRTALLRTEIFFIALLLGINPWVRFLLNGQRESVRVWLFGAGLCLLVVPAHAALSGCVARLYRRLLAPASADSPRRLAMDWGALYLALLSGGPMFAFLTRNRMLFDAHDLLIWCAAATAIPLALAAMTLSAAADRRHREEWESLVETD